MGMFKKKSSRFFGGVKEKTDDVQNDVEHVALQLKKKEGVAKDKAKRLNTNAVKLHSAAKYEAQAFRHKVKNAVKALKK